jgi:hypothetical protein
MAPVAGCSVRFVLETIRSGGRAVKAGVCAMGHVRLRYLYLAVSNVTTLKTIDSVRYSNIK